MADFSYLLNAQTPQLPSPLTMAAQGMQLADSASGLQQKQMAIQAQQQYQQAVPMLMKGASLSDIGQQFPLAYAKILSDVKANELTQAQIGEAQGKTVASQSEAFKNTLGPTGNMAGAVTQAVQSGQPISPMAKQGLAMQFSHALIVGGMDPKQFPIPDVNAPDSEWAQFAGLAHAASTSPKDAADIYKIVTMTPLEAQGTQATTAKTQMETGLAPVIAQSGRISANAAAANAQTNRLEFQNPAPVASALTGGLQIPQRQIGPNGTVSTTYSPATDTTGAPVQTALNAGQKAQLPGAEDALKQSQTSLIQSQGVLRLVPQLKAMIASGYNGPIAASDSGKQILNGLAAAGIMSEDQVAKLGNMRASDALTAELLGPMARQFNSRGSNAAMKFAQSVKPGSENALPVRMQMLNYLQQDAQNVTNVEQARQGYAASHPNDLGMTGFTPPAPVTSGPGGGQFAAQAPNGKTYTFPSEAAMAAAKFQWSKSG